MTAGAIRNAATEEGFIKLVSRLWETKPHIATGPAASSASCTRGRSLSPTLGAPGLFSGRRLAAPGGVLRCSCPVSTNVNHEGVRQEVMAQHPDDPHMVVFKHGVWRVKGIIQVSRSIGDAYLKHPRYNTEQIHAKFRQKFSRPLLSANPSIVSRSLQPSDCFIIFASDGLWEQLSNKEAVEIVHNHQRAGSARRLIKAALGAAVRKHDMRYSDLMKIGEGIRRHFHDDITVIVLFIDYDLLVKGHAQGQPLSIRCAL